MIRQGAKSKFTDKTVDEKSSYAKYTVNTKLTRMLKAASQLQSKKKNEGPRFKSSFGPSTVKSERSTVAKSRMKIGD